MQRDLKIILGQQLRKEFRVSDDLPFPMRKALEALAKAPALSADDDDADRRCHAQQHLARDGS